MFLELNFHILRSNHNSQAISTCCEKSDGLSHDQLTAVPSAQIAILDKTSSEKQLKQKKEIDQKEF